MFYDITVLSTPACCVRVRERQRSCASVTWLVIVESGVTDKITKAGMQWKDTEKKEGGETGRNEDVETDVIKWREHNAVCGTAVHKIISWCPLVQLHS